MTKKKSKAKDQVKGPNEEFDFVAEDGGEVTEEIEEIYNYDKEKKAEKKNYRDRLPAVPDNKTAIIADTFEVPRVCENCYLQDRCNFYEEDATCRFRTQVSINNPQDIFELIKMLMEIQGERVIFGRFIEMMEGGYVDRNLSEEIKRLMELMKNFKEIVKEEESINISIRGKEAVKGGGGILSQIFGGGDSKDENSKDGQDTD